MEGAVEPQDLDEAALGGIPSLDFRPVLELFAPTGDKLQVSPCEECGGTLEVRFVVYLFADETSAGDSM